MMAILRKIKLANGNLWVVWYNYQTKTTYAKEISL